PQTRGDIEIVAATEGQIISITREGEILGLNGTGYGVHVTVQDSRTGLKFLYGHMKSGSIPDELSMGSIVQAGDKLGLMGTTGRSTGVHLHFGISKEGTPDFDPSVPAFKGLHLNPLDGRYFAFK